MQESHGTVAGRRTAWRRTIVITRFQRRLDRLQENLSKRSSDLLDMTDDQLAGVIVGNQAAKASDLMDSQLEAIVHQAAKKANGSR